MGDGMVHSRVTDELDGIVGLVSLMVPVVVET
jgi:hypothetical protein